MSTTPSSMDSDYVAGYAKGRHASKEHVPAGENPFRPGRPAFHGWNDGHYDERSARSVAIERHSALLWSRSDADSASAGLERNGQSDWGR